MGLLDYFDPDAIRGKLKGLLAGMPITQLLQGNMPTVDGLKAELLKSQPFNAQDLTGAMEGANWANPMMAAKIVYHGSPHKFDKFDASKIGTGEGAQAYGHGIYMADNPAVARQYSEALSGPEIVFGNAVVTPKAGSIEDRAKAWIEGIPLNNPAPFDAAIDAARRGMNKATFPEVDAIVSRLEAWRDAGAKVRPGGATYKADLPDEWIPKMLDWDKPLSQQPENVRLLAHDLGLAKDATGKDVYSALSNQARDMGIIKGQNAQTTLPGSQSRAATDLSEFGIPGIRYLDGGSRPNSGRITMLEQTIANLQGKGASKAAIANAQRELDAELARASYNYVVFPGLEDKVKILERNGIPLTGLMGK